MRRITFAVQMQTASVIVKPLTVEGARHRHTGVHPVLVPEGEGEWRYERLTPEQLRYWNHLRDYERNLFVWRLRDRCFQCGLRAAMRGEKRFEDGLHAAMMTSLLLDY